MTDGRRDRRERTRTALLSAARRLWAERGIHGASLDDIAAAAGLTKGAVYSNFTGKTDLVLALMEHCAASPDVADLTDRPDDARLLAMLLAEFWLYGMRDYAAGWRVAESYAERRTRLAGDAAADAPGEATAEERAALALALDFGLAVQHLLDPDTVPAGLYATGRRLVLGDSVG
ncbi:TetR/AcrR family transcriptional regulator [Actinomadura flavalba]|uniref:TetR/AcrR family transcriptional regulator n=1 Tax=Actinomadura flavalba TaxID=1120938 RepID=UPI000375CE3C|nr:TetR/AcrR family transcriptional regulator [Actinomadura flavalba]